MHRTLALTCALAVLVALPASAQDPAPPQVIDKVKLTYLSPKELLPELPSPRVGVGLKGAAEKPIAPFPAGITGILLYPLDNALILRGTLPALAEVKAAIGVVDVPSDAAGI